MKNTNVICIKSLSQINKKWLKKHSDYVVNTLIDSSQLSLFESICISVISITKSLSLCHEQKQN